LGADCFQAQTQEDALGAVPMVQQMACSLNCRESKDVYTELLLPFNVRDRFVGGSGAAAGDPPLRIPTQKHVAAAEQTSEGNAYLFSQIMHIRIEQLSYLFTSFHIFS